MNIKIYYKSAIIWNVILLILLSFVFVYLSNAVYLSESIFNKSFLVAFTTSHKYLIALYFITAILTYKLSKRSKLLYILSCLSTVSFISFQLFNDFSKLILLILFLFVVVAYYIYYFLVTELAESFYNPLYTSEDLFEPMLKQFKCKVKWGDKELEGYLTNWSMAGFFLYIEQEIKDKLPKTLFVEIFHEDVTFNCKVRVVSRARDGHGLGLRIVEFPKDEDSDLSWFGFYEIIDKMGYQVEYLK